MAFSTMLFLKLSVFVFVFMCVYGFGNATKDVSYESAKKQDVEVSVIDLEEGGRYRRQADPSDPSNPSTTAPSVADPTTPFNTEGLNVFHDDLEYYSVTTYFKTTVDDYWVELKNVTGHKTLSQSHRTAVTAQLPFPFRFYGHQISNVTIATGGFMYMSPFIHKFLTATQYIAPLMANFETKSGGRNSTVLYKTYGFLYMSPFLHQWLTATQYIAPLMANFDTQIGNNSEILYLSSGSKFVVEWRDVHLQDQNGTDPFRFQAILHANGTIMFVYRQGSSYFSIRAYNATLCVALVSESNGHLTLPLPVQNISFDAHPVKVGLSDAFYFDTTQFGQTRRTIYEYHRVTVNTSRIQESTVIMLNPLPTCNMFNNCESCVGTSISFPCRWCGITQKCSDTLDWFRQEWMNNGCMQLSGAGNCSSIPTVRPQASTGKDNKGTTVAVIVIVVVIVVALIGSIGGWFYYAYSHPTSASGMWLMEHRPSQMKAKMNNMKFWKKNGGAGDKYAVESTA